MDDRRFDDLTRAMAGGISRRGLLRGLIGAGFGLGTGLGRGAVDAACPPDQLSRRGLGCVCRATGRPPHAQGHCPCPHGPTRCGDVCVELGRNPDNCGACGTACPTPADPCLIAACTGGVCGTAPAMAGTPCNDGDPCTENDACDGAGRCVGGSPVVCQALDQCHEAGICDPASGRCSNPNQADGASCNDGNACTHGDTCQAGVCTGGNPVFCPNANPCVTASCDPAIGCTTTPLPVGTPCPDFALCDGDEVCDGAGNCVEGRPTTCVEPGQCQEAGACDSMTGECVYANKANGIACDTGNPCTADACFGGDCHEGPDVVSPTCPAANQCHEAGTCDPATGTCTNPDQPNGTSCDDGNVCTQTDSCQAGVCVGGMAIACENDGLTCTERRCDPIQGCVNDVHSGFCAITEACYVDGDPNPTNPCQVCDTIRSQTGWSPLADDTSCASGDDRCRGIGNCQSGACVDQPVVCEQPTELCRQSRCDPDTGQCVEVLVHGFSDQKECLFCDRCIFGACPNPRTADCGECQTCDPAALQCVPLPAGSDCCGECRTYDPATLQCVPLPAGSDCGSTCNVRATCDPAGTCKLEAVFGLGCLNIGECPAMVCDPETAACLETGANDGKPCGGDLCRVCDDGQCVPRPCGACQQCDPASGQCVACEPCCKGVCGRAPCGMGCCAPGDVCAVGVCCSAARACTKGCCPEGGSCCTDQCCLVGEACCGNRCCPAGQTCCGVDADGDGACCPVDTTCCSTAFNTSCCAAHQTCGIFGCASF